MKKEEQMTNGNKILVPKTEGQTSLQKIEPYE
jgi:hypothetical protein